MPHMINAFTAGELVQIAGEARLNSALKRYQNGPEMLERLRAEVGRKFRVCGWSFPHGGGVLYQLEGLDGDVWEECLIDWTIQSDNPGYILASEIYIVDSAMRAARRTCL